MNGPTGPQGPQGMGRHSKIHRDDLDAPKAEKPMTIPAAMERIKAFLQSASTARKGLEVSCPFCSAAMVVQLRNSDGRAFLGCSRYPNCSGTWDVPSECQEEAKRWHRQLATPEHLSSMLPDSIRDRADALSDMMYMQKMVDPDTGEVIDDDIEDALRGLPAKRGRPKKASTSAPFAWESKVYHTFRAVKDINLGSGHLKIRRDDEFYFDGETLLYLEEMSLLPELKALLHTDWVVHLGPSETAEIAAYTARIAARRAAEAKKEMAMKEAMDEAADVPSSSIKARLARSAKKAPVRVARMRAISEGKKAILGALRPRLKAPTFELVEAFLSTDAGQGAILSLVGLAGPYTPKIGKNKHVQAVCDEFLEEGVALGANEVFGILGMILEPVLKSVMSQLPGVDEIADKVVAKRSRKRVASPVRVKRDDEAAEGEEEEAPEPRRKNALRAL